MRSLFPRSSALSGLSLLAVMLLWASSGRAQRPIAGVQTPVLPAGAADTGRLPGSEEVSFTIYLAPPAERVAALDAAVVAASQPGSAGYRHWITPGEFAAQYGANADQVAQVQAWAAASGLSAGAVSAAGTRIRLAGTVAAVEAALAPGLRGVQLAGQPFRASSAVPSVADGVAGDFLTVDGLTTVPEAHPLAVVADSATRGQAQAQGSGTGLAALSAVVEANAGRVLLLSSSACVEDVDAATQAAVHLLLKEAALQGMTVIAASGCSGRGAASFPGALSEGITAAVVPGVGLPTADVQAAEEASESAEAWPVWQIAPGLPADALRQEPDLTVSGLAALAATVEAILARQPATADGSPVRLGNIAQTIYALAPTAGLFTQPDTAAAGTPGSWERGTGLGVVDLDRLQKAFPAGVLADTVLVQPSSYSITHGQNVVLSVKVSDASGGGGTPSGTVTLSFAPGGYSATVTLAGGQATLNTSALPTTLPAANYTVTATYAGDGSFSGASGSTGLYVGPEALTLAAVATGTPTVGGSYPLAVTLTAPSGTGAPAGSLTITPSGGATLTPNYTSTTAGVGAATVTLPANVAGNISISVQCNSGDASYTCSSTQLTVSVSKALPVLAVTLTPNPPVFGQSTTLTATLSSAGGSAPAPTGSVTFTDSAGTPLSAGYSSSGTASTTTNALTGTVAHTITAQYAGDANYTAASGTAITVGTKITTTTLVTSSKSVVLVGGAVTLTAAVTPATQLTGLAPTGTVTFYNAAGQIGTPVIFTSGATSVTTSATFSTVGTQAIYAIYSGDANYSKSTSTPVTNVLVGPATGVTITATPTGIVPYGTAIAFKAVVAATPTDATGALAGTINFNIASTTPSTLSGALVSAGTTGTATAATVTALPVGSYTVTASCTAANFDCTSIATAGSYAFAVTKAATTTTLVTTPPSPAAGTTITLTATVAPTLAPTALGTALTGNVAFYANGTSLATVALASGVATTTFTLGASGTNVLTAIYSGDANNLTSTSGSLSTGPVAVVTGTVVTANPSNSLAGGNVLLTAVVTLVPVATTSTTTSVPAAASPTGVVSFYDTYNGLQTLLGTGTLVSSGQYTALAQLGTTGLLDGSHSITAVYAGTTTITSSLSAALPVQVSDFSVSFTPATLTIARGGTATVPVAIGSINGFAGAVALGCTPPAASQMKCSFSIGSVSGAGASSLTISTTAPQKAARILSASELGGLGMLLAGLLLTRRRGARPRWLLMMVLGLLVGTVGCTNLNNTVTGSSPTSATVGGTPLGAQLITITASGTDGRTTEIHSSQFQVTVQ